MFVLGNRIWRSGKQTTILTPREFTFRAFAGVTVAGDDLLFFRRNRKRTRRVNWCGGGVIEPVGETRGELVADRRGDFTNDLPFWRGLWNLNNTIMPPSRRPGIVVTDFVCHKTKRIRKRLPLPYNSVDIYTDRWFDDRFTVIYWLVHFYDINFVCTSSGHSGAIEKPRHFEVSKSR